MDNRFNQQLPNTQHQTGARLTWTFRSDASSKFTKPADEIICQKSSWPGTNNAPRIRSMDSVTQYNVHTRYTRSHQCVGHGLGWIGKRWKQGCAAISSRKYTGNHLCKHYKFLFNETYTESWTECLSRIGWINLRTNNKK